MVGAGPAGSCTAAELARRGREVVLVDRRTFPRTKACGDLLTTDAIRALQEQQHGGGQGVVRARNDLGDER